ncbi:MAG: hypothetical protein NTX00_02065 [Candidatus Parcubacteria bacterium]|nr:hypothetical protein [Candidatus Parcubacteria bacterium]
MLKTIGIIIIFLLFAIFIAFIFSFFIIPQEKVRFQDCVLLQDPKAKTVDCFGCTNNICKDAPKNWIIYQKPEIGIPYACFKSEKGCQLAQ